MALPCPPPQVTGPVEAATVRLSGEGSPRAGPAQPRPFCLPAQPGQVFDCTDPLLQVGKLRPKDPLPTAGVSGLAGGCQGFQRHQSTWGACAQRGARGTRYPRHLVSRPIPQGPVRLGTGTMGAVRVRVWAAGHGDWRRGLAPEPLPQAWAGQPRLGTAGLRTVALPLRKPQRPALCEHSVDTGWGRTGTPPSLEVGAGRGRQGREAGASGHTAGQADRQAGVPLSGAAGTELDHHSGLQATGSTSPPPPLRLAPPSVTCVLEPVGVCVH